MNKNVHMVLATCLMGSLPLLVGCKSNPVKRVPFQVPVVAFTDDGQYLPQRVGPGLVADLDSPIPDVPMPIGFKPVISRCSSSFDGVARTVTHVYQGRATAAETAIFYRQQLPFFKWELQNRTDQEDGSIILNYTKGREALNVRVSSRFNVSTVEVYITPR